MPSPSSHHAYHGLRTLDAPLPLTTEIWPSERGDYDLSPRDLARYASERPWSWTGQRVYFLCDLHADTDAFMASLVATGGVIKYGPKDEDFRLSEEGKEATFVIGGDCFDKGPENLRLLRSIAALKAKGAKLRLLAGNHDLRTLVGLSYIGHDDPRFAHLFVRMGKKTMPLFKEVHEQYIAGGAPPSGVPSEAEIRERLFPPESWYDAFPRAAEGLIPPPKLKKELVRIREKVRDLEAISATIGLSLRDIYVAVQRTRELLAIPGGEFSWVFDDMQLAARFGSYLFIHAGLDDQTAKVLREQGVDGLNRWFREMVRDDLFALYYGPVGNGFRTKYRDIDWPLTEAGVAQIHRAGVYGIVHGHRNILRGQRMILRRGILNFECDASVDINTRRIEGLPGAAGAATVFRPDGRVLGVSSDHPHIKVFDPSRFTTLTITSPSTEKR